MKNIITLCGILAFTAVVSSAQSLQDNPDYRKSLELREQSRAAFDSGDFPEARRLAEEAKAYAEKSDLWIAEQLARYRANAARLRVRNRLREIDQFRGARSFPDEYARGRELYEKADDEFREQSWELSRTTADEALDVLSVIVHIPSADTALPAAYVVRRLPGNADCLWNIAGYDFIYGEPREWRRIYNANRDSMPQKDNPDLIHPGMVLLIPAREGENRSGTWDNGEIR